MLGWFKVNVMYKAKLLNYASQSRIIATHIFIGSSIFYFLVHPFTMVLYWFEVNNMSYSYSLFSNVFVERLKSTFSFNMIGMGIWLAIFGGILGLISGVNWILYKKKSTLIKKQENLLKRDIQNLIESGESDRLEFKSSIRYDFVKKETNKNLEIVIAKTIAGFMNANGGKLIIGVDDHGEILGVEKDFNTLKHKNKDGFERRIYEIVSALIGHKFCFNIHVAFYNI